MAAPRNDDATEAATMTDGDDGGDFDGVLDVAAARSATLAALVTPLPSAEPAFSAAAMINDDGDSAATAADNAEEMTRELLAGYAAALRFEPSADAAAANNAAAAPTPKVRLERGVIAQTNAALRERLLSGANAAPTRAQLDAVEAELRARVPMLRDPVTGAERPVDFAVRADVEALAASGRANVFVVGEPSYELPPPPAAKDSADGNRAAAASSGGGGAPATALTTTTTTGVQWQSRRDMPRDPQTGAVALRFETLPFAARYVFPLRNVEFVAYMTRTLADAAELLTLLPLMPCAVRTPRLLLLLGGQRMMYASCSFNDVLMFYAPALRYALATRDMCRPSADIERYIAGVAIADEADGDAVARDADRQPWRVRIAGVPPGTTREALYQALQHSIDVAAALEAHDALGVNADGTRATLALGALFGVADMTAGDADEPRAAGSTLHFELTVASRAVAAALRTALHGSALRGLWAGGGWAAWPLSLSMYELPPAHETPFNYFEYFVRPRAQPALRAAYARHVAPHYAAGSGRAWRFFVPALRAADGVVVDVDDAGGAAALAQLQAAFLNCRERVLHDFDAWRGAWLVAHTDAVIAAVTAAAAADGAVEHEDDADSNGGVLTVALERALQRENAYATVELLRLYEVTLMRCFASVITESSWRTSFVSQHASDACGGGGAGGGADDLMPSSLVAAQVERAIAAASVAVATRRRHLIRITAAPDNDNNNNNSADDVDAVPTLGPRDEPVAALDVRRAWRQYADFVARDVPLSAVAAAAPAATPMESE